MLKFISIFSLLVANSLFAQDEGVLLEKCFKKVKSHYNRHGSISDTTKTVNHVKYLKAGEFLKGFKDQDLIKYDQDVLVYTGTGSYYSGYFQDLIVADPKNCSVLDIINIYSE